MIWSSAQDSSQAQIQLVWILNNNLFLARQKLVLLTNQ